MTTPAGTGASTISFIVTSTGTGLTITSFSPTSGSVGTAVRDERDRVHQSAARSG